MTPKVFISYSWSSPGHQEVVREWAERLLDDHVDVVLDVFDLKEGHDKYAFMERMVTDENVSHVLIISDKKYAEKADARKAGVGTESQIISKEVYDKVAQSKFIPIVCEFGDDGEPFLPTFLKSRKWINFSSPEAVNENWEQLIRVLYGKPFHEKPKLGKVPAYIQEDTAAPSSPALAKFASLRQAILQSKRGIGIYRQDFLDACIEFADNLRVRKRPKEGGNIGERILQDCGKLLRVRDHIVDWVLLESQAAPSEDFSEALISLLERLRDLKSRPSELNEWSDAWFEAHSLFAYETFLYIVATLLKTQAYGDLHNIFASHYVVPETESYGSGRFERFDAFWAQSQMLGSVLSPPGQRLYSPAAELIKRQAQRTDIPFSAIMQADLLVLLLAFIYTDTRWYPQTLLYAGRASSFPFFIRASQHKNFKKLVKITGVDSADVLREAVKKGAERLQLEMWEGFHFVNYAHALNLEKLDTIE